MEKRVRQSQGTLFRRFYSDAHKSLRAQCALSAIIITAILAPSPVATYKRFAALHEPRMPSCTVARGAERCEDLDKESANKREARTKTELAQSRSPLARLPETQVRGSNLRRGKGGIYTATVSLIEGGRETVRTEMSEGETTQMPYGGTILPVIFAGVENGAPVFKTISRKD